MTASAREPKDTPVGDLLEEQAQARLASVLAKCCVGGGSLKGVGVNLQRMMQTPLSQAITEWMMLEHAVIGHASAVVELLGRLVEGNRVTPLDEISLLSRGLSPRDRIFVSRYLELDGRPGDTLEALGAEAGVTRERVRQIVQRFSDRTTRLRPPLPICEAVVATLRALPGPTTLELWNERLPELVRADSPSDLTALRTLEIWGWLPKSTWLYGGGIVLVVQGESQEENGREFLRQVSAALRRAMALGAASVGQLSLVLDQQRTVVESLLRSSGRWEQVDGEWFVLRECVGYLLPRVAAKMLAVLGPLTLDQIRSGLRRYRDGRFRQRLEVPPRPILRRVLQAGGMRVSDNGDVVNLVEAPSPVTLSGGEAALVDAFRDEGVLTLHEVVSAIKEQGLSEAMGSYLLTSSPLISRVTYGLYALRARRVTHAEIDIAAGRLIEQSERSLVDQRFQVDGSVLARYRLPADRDLVTFYIRPGMIPEGVWTLIDGHGRESILVRSTYVTGLQQVGRRMKKAGAIEIDVRFDVGRGEVTVAVPPKGK
jgi:hypothetical protein